MAVDLDSVADFAKIAEGFGVAGRRVEDPAELPAAIEWAERMNGPIVLDILIDEEANVFPMLPPGAALNEMIGVTGILEP